MNLCTFTAERTEFEECSSHQYSPALLVASLLVTFTRLLADHGGSWQLQYHMIVFVIMTRGRPPLVV